MASAKLQKPTNEEHKFSQKITEVTAWGNRVFGHKQQEHQAANKHCTTCQCSAPKDTKPACADMQKREQAKKDMKSGAFTERKKKEKEEPTNAVHMDTKHTSCIELKRKEKQHKENVQTKNSKQPASAEMKRKDKKEHHAISSTADASNILSKKDHKNEPVNHCFSSMADHWKDKIMMMKKGKDGKCKESSSSSSDSDSEDEAIKIKKTNKKHSQEAKTTSK